MANAWADPDEMLGSDLSGVMDSILEVLASARRAELPIFFTTMAYDAELVEIGRVVQAKTPHSRLMIRGSDRVALLPELERQPHEPLIEKPRASAFYGTNLLATLISERVDTVIVVGCSTSGCIRSTCESAFNTNLRAIVPREAVGDRSPTAHASGLFDIDARFADVVDLSRRDLAPGQHCTARSVIDLLIRDVELTDSRRASIAVSDGRIASIGATPSEEARETIDGISLLAMPALANAHLHSMEVFQRGSVCCLPLELYRLRIVPPVTASTPSPEEVYVRTLVACIEMLKGGIALAFDDVLHEPYLNTDSWDAVLRAYEVSGMRALVSMHLEDVPWDRQVPFVERRARRRPRTPGCRRRDRCLPGFRWAPTCG